ncbi:MAG: MFS transporter [Saprospiraceae bacterium]|nr:MFS transporter [Saprospiraceae bacterium]MBP6446372.1 MFS transporter [Saprospiraceae bacterium]
MEQINRNRLFIASCFALITTALAFGIRAGIMTDLVKDMQLNDTQLGWINFMGAFGFPIATLVGGSMYNHFGPKKIGYIAFFSHLFGIGFSILSGSFLPLFISTFFISFGNGMVEAAYNPMIADMYPDDKAKMLNKFHVWFPGGIAIGAIITMVIASMSGSWQVKLAVMFIPLIIYGYLFWGQTFPKTDNELGKASTMDNLKASLTSPLYWVMLVCMTLTATTELGTTSWVERILGNSGAQPLIILFLVTGLMALGRYFAGPIIHRLDITGVLFASAIISAISIGLLSTGTGNIVYLYAILFAIGVCYFWPTMISFVAEYLPKSGAFGMSLIGGVGMVGLAIFQPVIGRWMDTERSKALDSGLTGDAAELAAGQATLDNIAIFPGILVVVFGVLFFMRKKLKPAGQTASYH